MTFDYTKGFERLIARLRRGINKGKESTKSNPDLVIGAKALVVGLMDNLVRFIKEHPEM
jgi:hypothetical protein